MSHEYLGLADIYPGVLREQGEVVAKLLSVILGKLWLSGKVCQEWKNKTKQNKNNKRSITPIYKDGRKVDCGNYRLVNFTSVLGTAMEQILLKDMLKHMSTSGPRLWLHQGRNKPDQSGGLL